MVDTESRECVVVDPAWAVDDLLDLVEQDDMTLVGALATHYHPDHVGGTMYGVTVEGLPRLMERCPVPVHALNLECDGIAQITGIDRSDLVRHDSGDIVKVGDIEIESMRFLFMENLNSSRYQPVLSSRLPENFVPVESDMALTVVHWLGSSASEPSRSIGTVRASIRSYDDARVPEMGMLPVPSACR